METPLEYEAYETAYDDMHTEEGMKKSKVWGAKKIFHHICAVKK